MVGSFRCTWISVSYDPPGPACGYCLLDGFGGMSNNRFHLSGKQHILSYASCCLVGFRTVRVIFSDSLATSPRSASGLEKTAYVDNHRPSPDTRLVSLACEQKEGLCTRGRIQTNMSFSVSFHEAFLPQAPRSGPSPRDAFRLPWGEMEITFTRAVFSDLTEKADA